MKYVLLKRTDGQILIIDNSTHIGKGRVDSLCLSGTTSVGTIESDLTPHQLMHGFEHTTREHYNALHKMIALAQKALDGALIE